MQTKDNDGPSSGTGGKDKKDKDIKWRCGGKHQHDFRMNLWRMRRGITGDARDSGLNNWVGVDVKGRA